MARSRKPGRGHDARGRSQRADRFVRLRHNLLDSEAWASLSCAQRCVYLALERHYNGFNNGEIGASVRNLAREAKCNKDTVVAALRTLAERGFIVRSKDGGFSMKIRHSAEYRLTAHETTCGGRRLAPTQEFLLWKKNRGPN